VGTTTVETGDSEGGTVGMNQIKSSRIAKGVAVFFLVCQATVMLMFWTHFNSSHMSLQSKQSLLDSQFAKNAEQRNEMQAIRLDLTEALTELNETRDQVESTKAKLLQTEIQLHTYRLQLKQALLESDSTGAVVKFLDKADAVPLIADVPHRAGAKWLVIAMPTVPRKSSEASRYLEESLAAFAAQMPTSSADPLFDHVVLMVCNNRPDRHEQFNSLRAKYQATVHRDHFAFVEQSIANPEPDKHDEGNRDRPGWKVRQQTRDVVGMLRKAQTLGSYVLIQEDDFVLCPHGLRALHYFIDKANHYNPDWIGLRVSYGLSGFVFKSSDVTQLADYLEKHAARRPPDHLVPEYIGKESPESKALLGARRNMAVRWNLLSHIGKWSTLRTAKSPGYPGCYTPLVYPVVFEVDGFNEKACPNDDVYPCDRKAQEFPNFRVTFGAEMKPLDK